MDKVVKGPLVGAGIGGPGFFLFGEAERNAVEEALDQRALWRYRMSADEPTSNVDQFERDFAAVIGVPNVIAMNSCTSALLSGLLALGIGPGDEVLVPGYCFVADIAAIRYVGARPVFVEIDSQLGMNPREAEKAIGHRTKAIICVHMLGRPADAVGLRVVADRHGLFLIEDVAQALGASCEGRMLGSYGDIAVFSFNIFKTITTGDGGMLAVRSYDVFERAYAIHDHGSTPFRSGRVRASLGLGLNFRLHELAAALGRVQLTRLQEVVGRCREHWQALDAYVRELERQHNGVSVLRFSTSADDCCTVFLLQFATEQLAAGLATALKTRTLADTGRHCYYHMPTESVSVDQVDCPLFPRGMLPETDSILSRTVAISVGVVDDYLGTGAGLNPLSSPEEIAQFGNRLQAALRQTLDRI